jgi:hypothetical protein
MDDDAPPSAAGELRGDKGREWEGGSGAAGSQTLHAQGRSVFLKTQKSGH